MRVGTGAATVLVLVGLLTGCPLPTWGEHDETQAELNRQRRVWREGGITSYDYVVRRSCFCPQELVAPVTVRVRAGQVVERVYTESGHPVRAEHARFWPDVEGLFDVVQDAIDQRAHSIDVEFDPGLGYPTRVYVDYQRNAVDEELGLSAYHLTRVP